MISDWAVDYRISIVRCEDRPDRPQGEIVYRIKDIFTTCDGSWEPSDKRGSVPLWARQLYLRPGNAPDVFDDAGGDHHLFARVVDLAGQPVKAENSVRYWSDGLHCLGDSSYQGYVRVTPKERSGWANLVMFNSSFSPERGEQGPWCWCPEGAADVIVGGGMPMNHHVSFFAVWQAEHRQKNNQENGNDEQQGDKIQPITINFDEIRRGVWSQLGIQFNPESAFARYARQQKLGAPLTNEFDLGSNRVQGFVEGIVFAPVGQWQAMQHVGW